MSSTKTTKRWLVGSAVAGTMLGAVAVAVAATGRQSSSSRDAATLTAAPAVATSPIRAAVQQQAPPTTTPGRPAQPKDDNRPAETPLTGDTADKVKAAALAAVPGATVERVETDSGGSPYEAHVTKPDGSHATVKVDKDFKVTSVENDGDHGGRGGRGPGGPGHGRGGPAETPLTGDTADKVKAAALSAVPGATVDRVETDSDGSPYEAHVTKPDGSHATVKVDKDFKVTSVDSGH